jgi:hypothetical protein
MTVTERCRVFAPRLTLTGLPLPCLASRFAERSEVKRVEGSLRLPRAVF